MALKGDLASVDLAQVFQMLALNQKAGLLRIEGASQERALYFDDRGVTLRYTAHLLYQQALEESLRLGQIDEATLQEARSRANGQDNQAASLLLEARNLNGPELEAICRSRIEEEIYELFFWRDARFEFLEEATTLPGRDGVIDERFFFSPDALIMEAARRLDEWAYIRELVPGDGEIYQVVVEDLSASLGRLDDDGMAVLERIDGMRTVGRLTEMTGISRFHLHKAMAMLVDNGLVVPVPAEELLPRAETCLTEGRTTDAIHLLERSILEGVEVASCQALAAGAYEKLGELAAAVYHWKGHAESLVEAGRTADAIQALAHVRRQLPTDLSARERLVEVYTTFGKGTALDGYDPIAEGKTLVDVLVEMGETERARSVLENLLVGRSADIELKKSLVGVHTRAGDTKRVLELYESIAADLVANHDLIGAIKFLQKILMFDRSRKDISERIRQLYVLDERMRIRKRGLNTAIAVVFCICILGAIYYFYESHVRSIYNSLPPQAELYVAQNDHAAALALYNDFLRRYPLTLMVSDAHAEIGRITSLKAARDEEMRDKALRVEAQRQKVRSEYREVWAEFQKLDRQPEDLQQLTVLLERIQELVNTADSEEDRGWLQEVKVNERLNAIKSHIAEAWLLARRAETAMQEKKYLDAYALVRELHTAYRLTDKAKSTPLPILLESRPAGANVKVDGVELTEQVDGETRQLVTPVVVSVELGRSRKIELSKPGHDTMTATLSADSACPLVLDLLVRPVVELDVVKRASGGLAVDGSLALLGAPGQVIAFDLDQKRTRFTFPIDGLAELAGDPVVIGELALCALSDGRLLAISLLDGRPIWNKVVGRPVHGGVLHKDGFVYLANAEGALTCLHAQSGETSWTVSLGASLPCAPALEGTRLFALTSDRQLSVLRTDSGAVQWRKELSGTATAPLLAAHDRLLVASDDGIVHCLHQGDGTVAWSYRHKGGNGATELVLDAASVLIGTADGRLARMRLADGRQEAATTLAGRLVAQPVLAGSAVHVLLQDGEGKRVLRSLADHDLALLWQYPFVGSQPLAQKPRADATIVLTDAGRLLGFR